jgi:hypothetical protein
MQNIPSMAIVLEDPKEAKEKAILSREGLRISGKKMIDRKLHAAQEILAEVFGITVAEAEEMIKQRSRERTVWPENFQSED